MQTKSLSHGSARDFTQGSIFGKLLRFTLPILGAQVLQAMYGAVDLLVVGRFGTNAGISGVATGSGVLHTVTFVVTALASAVTILIGRCLGAKQEDRISKLLGSAIALFLAIAAAMTVLLVAFARPIAILMKAPTEEAVELTAQYIRICGIGSLFIVFYNLISSIFRGLGDSRTPLLLVAIACTVNIVADLVLIAALDMNVVGAAIATVAAQAISVLLSLLVIRKRGLGFRFRAKDIGFGKDTASILKVGTPLALQELLTSISFLMLCAFINNLGLDASNGYGIAQKLTAFIMLIPSSLMQSMSAFVAQNVGANQEGRAKKGMFYGMAVGAGIGLVIAVAVFFKGDLLASAFSSNVRDIARAHEYLRGFAVESAITCILFSFMGYFNGHARSTFVMLQGLVQSFLIRLPMAYIMSIQPDASLTNIGLAVPTATVVGIVICTIYYRRMQKQL
jgi:putative MATE family efflux protein